MPHKHPALRPLATSAMAAALTITGLAVTTTPASALAQPGGVKTEIRNSSTAVLSWSAVKKASAYEVQVDPSSSFSIHGTEPNWAQAYEFDIYLRGPAATPFEEAL